MLVKFSLILALGLLPLLFIIPKSYGIKKFIFPLFGIALIAHIGVLILDPNPLNFKFLGVFKSLAVLAAVSAIFNFTKSNKVVQIALFIALLAGLKYYAGSNPVLAEDQSTSGLDDEFELLVRFEEGKNLDDLSSVISKYELTGKKAFEPARANDTRLDDYYLLGIPDRYESKLKQIKEAINKDSDTDWVENNEEIKVAPLEAISPARVNRPKVALNDPLLDQQWGLTKTNIGEYYDWINESKPIPLKKARIAILDTGVDKNHEDLKDNYKSIRKSHDTDPKGHGTLCAGVAAAVSNNGIGIASLVPGNDYVEVSSIKVLNSFGMGTQHKIIKGIIEAADNNSDVISMSLGGPSSDSKQKAYNEAVAYANQTDCIVVVAAGNSNRNAAGFSPANTKGVITVSALDENLNRAVFSNTVEDIEMAVAAPGVNIHSTYPGNKYGSYSGTSFAAPYVAGLVAVMKSIKPDLTTEMAFDILNNSGISVKASNKTGNIISPKAALDRLVGEAN